MWLYWRTYCSDMPRKRPTVLKPVRVSASIQRTYRARLQASNQAYKKQVDKKVKKILARIENFDRTDPDEFFKQVELARKDIDGLQRNLAAANKRSEKAVDVFINKTNAENKARAVKSFGPQLGTEKVEAIIAEKNALSDKRLKKLSNDYKKSIRAANQAYSDRVQAALFKSLGDPNFTAAKARKEVTRSKGIVTRRIKNTVVNQAHEANAVLNRVRQAALGAKSYRWQTKEDSKVRKTHKAHNRKIFNWAKRPVTSGHPGEDHGCRCIARPVI